MDLIPSYNPKKQITIIMCYEKEEQSLVIMWIQ